MGCDIHIWAERQVGDHHEPLTGFKFSEGSQPFDWRAYGMYGFLAGVRNYSDVTPISEPRGFPDDASPEVRSDFDEWGHDGHSASWLSVAELAAFNYDQPMEDRRITVREPSGIINGSATAQPGDGKMMTYREFLGTLFFDDLTKLTEAGASRVVFWFDN